MRPLSEDVRMEIWGPFLGLNDGVLPKHRRERGGAVWGEMFGGFGLDVVVFLVVVCVFFGVHRLEHFDCWSCASKVFQSPREETEATQKRRKLKQRPTSES